MASTFSLPVTVRKEDVSSNGDCIGGVGTKERNPHNLMRDFEDEIPGYLQNRAICEALAQLELKSGAAHIADNLRSCYIALVKRGWLADNELELLEAWLEDLQSVDRLRQR